MKLAWKQFKSLYKKDWLIRKRHWIATLIELFLPIVLVGLNLWSVSYARSLPSAKRLKMFVSNNLNVQSKSTFACGYPSGRLYFTPINADDNLLIGKGIPDCHLTSQGYPDQQQLIKDWGNKLHSLVINRNFALFFNDINLSASQVNYTVKLINLPYSGPWSTRFIDSRQLADFVKIQSIINLQLVFYPEQLTVLKSSYDYSDQLFPENGQVNSKSNPSTTTTLSPDTLSFYQTYFFLEVSLLYMVSIITRRIVKEKSTNAKELLRIMGMTDTVYWLSQFVNYFIISLFHSIVIAAMYFSFPDESPFTNLNPVIFVISYLIVCVSTILFTFTLTTIINRPIVGVLVALTVRIGLSYLPYEARRIQGEFLGLSTITWSCLVPSSGLYFSIYDIMLYGLTDQDFWSQLFTPINSNNSVELGIIWVTSFISWIIYIATTWYIGSVWPWQSGTPKPWYFPIKFLINQRSYNYKELASDNSETWLREPFPPDLKASISCKNVHKSFGSSLGNRKFAVDGLDLNIMKGQITALLGHNGAGKTTTMNMITGILQPTSGTIYVKDINVNENVVAARRSLGLCPQHDLLFRQLTVRENLELCAGLRGLDSKIKKQLIPLNLSRVNLTEKADELVKNLSGGMRRRLQLALALSTGSEILILDEPTSGLDPESRRRIWDLLLEIRKDLTILLTTHFMEEADALGDRIVIMASGKVKCSGSPMFLKNKLGTGHTLRIAKGSQFYDSSRVQRQITQFFPGASVISENRSEAIYRLIQETNSTNDANSKLANLCDDLDVHKKSLGITSYGISVTTLEDVFLRVTVNEMDLTTGNNSLINFESNEKLKVLNTVLNYTKLTGCALTVQQCKGLFLKRFHFTKRYFKVFLFTFILPVLITLFTCYATKNSIDNVDTIYPNYAYPIELNAKSIYGDIKAVIRATNSSAQRKFIQTYQEVNNELGVGITFINFSQSFDDFLKSESYSDKFRMQHVYGIIEKNSSTDDFMLWYNSKASLGLSLAVDAYTNTLLRMKKNTQTARVTTIYGSMPNRITHQPMIKTTIARLVITIFGPFAVCFLASSYFLFPAIETTTKTKLIQKISGIQAPIFWSSHYAFDLVYHVAVSAVIVTVILLYEGFLLINTENLASVALLYFLFGFAVIPFKYLFTFLPLTPDAGFALLIVITSVVTAVGSSIAALYVALDKLDSRDVIAADLFPPFAISFGLSKILAGSTRFKTCDDAEACSIGNRISRRFCCNRQGNLEEYRPFHWEDDGILPELTVLIIDALIYSVILLTIDMNSHRIRRWIENAKKWYYTKNKENTNTEDSDVLLEQQLVERLVTQPGLAHTEALISHNLTKNYGSFRAVNGLSFTVHPRECFGLLGVNGAGKTTTFSILTGDSVATSGDAFIKIHSLRNNLSDYQSLISYCPQYDALLGNLTPYESLELFARLKGMPESKVKVNVEHLIESTDLRRYARAKNKNLSGGNKRKLSLAIAAIGKPAVIFLDEPTTGVDPASRRKIWSTLIFLRDSFGSSIILTSHSMDECETLCSRIGIMANGKLKCLGSVQHLKQKFAQGFSLIIKLTQKGAKSPEEMGRIKEFITNRFPSSKLRDYHLTILHYHITDASTHWGYMFRTMNEACTKLEIEDFTLSGTSLEQIFLSFAHQQDSQNPI